MATSKEYKLRLTLPPKEPKQFPDPILDWKTRLFCDYKLNELFCVLIYTEGPVDVIMHLRVYSAEENLPAWIIGSFQGILVKAKDLFGGDLPIGIVAPPNVSEKYVWSEAAQVRLDKILEKDPSLHKDIDMVAKVWL